MISIEHLHKNTERPMGSRELRIREWAACNAYTLILMSLLFIGTWIAMFVLRITE